VDGGHHALGTHRQWSFGLLYFWGLTLCQHGPSDPPTRELEHDYPHPQFIMSWSSHCLVVLAAIYLTLSTLTVFEGDPHGP
jgi:uncharacterized membrane protein YwaF